jgi:hypothetical protein
MADEQPDSTPSTEAVRPSPPFRVVRRGFDRAQVLEHVRRADERVAELEHRLEQALVELADAQWQLGALKREREGAPSAERDPYEGVSEHVMELVRAFDREKELLRRRAELEATGLVAEARTEAARMRLEIQGAEERAHAQIQHLLAEAEEEAERVRAELAPLRELALSQARAIRDRMRLSLLELDAILPPEPAEAPAPNEVIVLEEASEAPAPPVDLPPA